MKTPTLAELHAQPHALLEVVTALLDCAAVLAALERTTECQPEGGMSTGAGFADGHQVRDASLPILLLHARDLVEQVQDYEPPDPAQ